MTEGKKRRRPWGFSKMEVGETRTVYDPQLFESAQIAVESTRYYYKDMRFLMRFFQGFLEVTRTR
jgi:hypothetical protein